MQATSATTMTTLTTAAMMTSLMSASPTPSSILMHSGAIAASTVTPNSTSEPHRLHTAASIDHVVVAVDMSAPLSTTVQDPDYLSEKKGGGGGKGFGGKPKAPKAGDGGGGAAAGTSGAEAVREAPKRMVVGMVAAFVSAFVVYHSV